MISVCMATYNGSRFIHQQVTSILSQIGPTDELIVSDDSSADDTLAQIKQLNDPRVKILINLGKRSPVYNFENALRHAKGQIIFLADQDDVWFPNKVETMLLYLGKYDLVVSNCDFIDEAGVASSISFFKSFYSGPGVLKNFVKNTYLGNCMAFRRTVLDRVLPFPNEIHCATKYLIYQDVWIGLIANSLFRVAFIPEKLSGFRRHSSNASPTEMNVKSPQLLIYRLFGRILLGIGLLKRIFKVN